MPEIGAKAQQARMSLRNQIQGTRARVHVPPFRVSFEFGSSIISDDLLLNIGSRTSKLEN